MKSYKEQQARAYKCRSPRFKEAVTKLISFINRTIEGLQLSLANLRKKYKTVRLVERKLQHGLWMGYIEIGM